MMECHLRHMVIMKDSLLKARKSLFQEMETNEQRNIYLSLKCNFYKASSPTTLSDLPPVFNTEAVIMYGLYTIQGANESIQKPTP